MKTKFWCPNCSYDWLHSLYIYCSFLPRFCFKYLVIHIESCFIIIFQCYKCIVISTGNQQQSENSVGNSDKPVVFMISSKGQGPGSQPEIDLHMTWVQNHCQPISKPLMSTNFNWNAPKKALFILLYWKSEF